MGCCQDIPIPLLSEAFHVIDLNIFKPSTNNEQFWSGFSHRGLLYCNALSAELQVLYQLLAARIWLLIQETLPPKSLTKLHEGAIFYKQLAGFVQKSHESAPSWRQKHSKPPNTFWQKRSHTTRGVAMRLSWGVASSEMPIDPIVVGLHHL